MYSNIFIFNTKTKNKTKPFNNEVLVDDWSNLNEPGIGGGCINGTGGYPIDVVVFVELLSFSFILITIFFIIELFVYLTNN